MSGNINILFVFITILVFVSNTYAQKDKNNAMPPAKVVVANVTADMITPESEFVGSVYYREVSEVASEVKGKVEHVDFEEGDRVIKGDSIVKLGSDLLLKSREAALAAYEQSLSDLRKAEKEFTRSKKLFKEELISEQSYDEKKFGYEGLEKKTASLKAELDRLQTELDKKIIKAPFSGVVIKRNVERGEWLSEGSMVATIAADDTLDIIAEVPESIINYIQNGMNVKASTGRGVITGKVISVIPRGDISTRTFPVKIRAQNTLSLLEGMEARVSLPTAKKQKTLAVPRDAVITVFGTTVVFAVNDTKAVMIPVNVTGYKGMTAGVNADGLQEGMKVVVKGNERLQDGQAVEIINPNSQAPNNK